MIGSRFGNSADARIASVIAKNYFEKIIRKNSHRLERKDILCFGLILCFFCVTFVFFLPAESTTTLTPIDPPITHIKDWATWKLGTGEQFHIDVLSSAELNEERMRAISDVLYSKERLDLDGKTLYKGWHAAISSTKNTKIPMPIELRTVRSYDGTGQILIELTDRKNPDGYVAFTESVFGEDDIHKLVVSKITIFNVENLGAEDFKKVLRHELGHAFGLSHSDDPDDLMYEVVKTPYPYISECDIQTIDGLYKGSETSWVSCEP